MPTYKDLTGIAVGNGGTAGMWNSGNNTKQVIVLHDTESGSAQGALDWMRSQQNGSYHLLIDLDGDVIRMVPDNRQAWAAMNSGNRIGLHICATGYAGWLSTKWDDYPQLLEYTAQYIAKWCIAYNIPPALLTPAQVRSGVKGICGHADISAAFHESDHTDPGPNFPKSLVINRVKAIMGGGGSNLLGLSDQDLALVATNFRQLGPT